MHTFESSTPQTETSSDSTLNMNHADDFSDEDDDVDSIAGRSLRLDNAETGVPTREACSEDCTDTSISAGRQETLGLRKLKGVVVAVLCTFMVGTAVGTYFVSAKHEQRTFELAFENTAIRLLESFYVRIDQQVSSLATLSTSFTSYAMATKQTWPNVTIADFHRRIETPSYVCRGQYLEFAPLLTTYEQRLQWEQYAIDHQHLRENMEPSDLNNDHDDNVGEVTLPPTELATGEPSQTPTMQPMEVGSKEPSQLPTVEPTIRKTKEPTEAPTPRFLFPPARTPAPSSSPTTQSQISTAKKSDPTAVPSQSPAAAVTPTMRPSEDDDDNNIFLRHSAGARKSEKEISQERDSPISSRRHRFLGHNHTRKIEEGISRIDQENGTLVDDETTTGPWSPVWQGRSFENRTLLNQLSEQVSTRAVETLIATNETVISEVFYDSFFRPTTDDATVNGSSHSTHETVIQWDSPMSVIYTPVFSDFVGNDTVGTVSVAFEWVKMLEYLLKDESAGTVELVLANTCGQSFRFFLDETEGATFAGEETSYYTSSRKDKYQDMARQSCSPELHFLSRSSPFNHQYLFGDNHSANELVCVYYVTAYPTQDFEAVYTTSKPIFLTLFVIAIFFACVVVFIVYDRSVERRQQVMVHSVSRTTRILDALFPENVRERVFQAANATRRGGGGGYIGKQRRRGSAITSPAFIPATNRTRLKSYLNTPNGAMIEYEGEAGGEPIADLFPETTVMFADIAGFTAWASEREPSQVFQLLETVYRAFDNVANRLGVFKVETIGDCYVAVTGCPEPHKDHALVMARFAYECISKMKALIMDLETILGPGTSDLSMRFGLHSGPVTAGVLRGEKSRFQLFGDTMNTSARMESTGERDRIQISPATAALLREAGKEHWLTPRNEKIDVKGKGEMQTFWLQPQPRTKQPNQQLVNRVPSLEPQESDQSILQPLPPRRSFSLTELPASMTKSDRLRVSSNGWEYPSYHDDNSSRISNLDGKDDRLVDWCSDVLLALLEKVVKQRLDVHGRTRGGVPMVIGPDSHRNSRTKPAFVRDEVEEVIALPEFNPKSTKRKAANSLASDNSGPKNKVPIQVRVQLRDYVASIASMYHDVPFHSFEHASHVTMSANKLLKRIISPEVHVKQQQQGDTIKKQMKTYASDVHKATFGISSDPMAQFAIVFSALVHDVDHTGVPNSTLVREHDPLALKYDNKSPAEQNSVDIAWAMLMQPQYADLQTCIFANNEECNRFRKLLVNSVMATDIVDAELKALRKNRWDKAFHRHLPRSSSNGLVASPPGPHQTSSNSSSSQQQDDAMSDVSSVGFDMQSVKSFQKKKHKKNKLRHRHSSHSLSDDDPHNAFADIVRMAAAEDMNRKATIVIEHIVQASDVAHCMQHWHIFTKWNAKLFEEMYTAYLEGRADKDPSENWYESEIGFFDFYIIPLARKLEECGVFGVSSHEYLTYALMNREEWVRDGRQVTEKMKAKTIQALQNNKYPPPVSSSTPDQHHHRRRRRSSHRSHRHHSKSSSSGVSPNGETGMKNREIHQQQMPQGRTVMQ